MQEAAGRAELSPVGGGLLGWASGYLGGQAGASKSCRFGPLFRKMVTLSRSRVWGIIGSFFSPPGNCSRIKPLERCPMARVMKE